jgi:undecaprenyl-diphosphatase
VLGLENASLTYDIFLHIATLIPVCIIFWDDIFKLIKNPFQKTTYLLVVATIPAVFVALIFGDFIDAHFRSGNFIAYAFIATGFILLYADKMSQKNYNNEDISYLDSLIVGVVQGFAIIPGVSRSGSTISALLSRKINREEAAKFSFLMSIPAIIGGFAFQLLRVFTGEEAIVIDAVPMAFGFIAAALSGYLAINFLMQLIKKAQLKYFSYYVFALALLIILDQAIFNMFF